MSFIVFSTRGTIIMPLTEKRYSKTTLTNPDNIHVARLQFTLLYKMLYLHFNYISPLSVVKGWYHQRSKYAEERNTRRWYIYEPWIGKGICILIIFKYLKSSDLPMFKVKVTSRQPCSSFLCIRSSMLFWGTCVLTSPVKLRPLPNPPPPFISLTLHDPFLKPVITIIDLYTCFPIAGKWANIS